jgi:hypothetical protein
MNNFNSDFEGYLISLGYKQYWINWQKYKTAKDAQLTEPKIKNYSSLGMIRSEWYKDEEIIKLIESGMIPNNREQYGIFYGLDEVGSPPHLIYPKPMVNDKPIECSKEMCGIHLKFSPEQILNSILNNKSL